MTLVTTVTTRAASSEDLTDAQYREIFDELRSKTTLRKFAEFIGSRYSFAWWSKYERGETDLTLQARRELRAIVGLPALPPTVAEATATADPDATVYQVGQAPADRLILIGSDVEDPLDLRINGHLSVQPSNLQPSNLQPVAESPVTPVTAPRSRKPTKAIRLSPDRFERLSALRKEAGLTWDELADWIEVLCGELGVEAKK